MGAVVTARTLSARMSALESRGAPAGGPFVAEIVFIDAVSGWRTDWDAHADAVIVNGTRHPVGDDETAHQAVERIVAAMHPRPHVVVALVEQDGPV